MILTDMKPNFNDVGDVEQQAIFQQYVFLRAKHLSEPIVTPRTKGKKRKAGKQKTVTKEQYDLLQSLGLI